MSNYRRNLRLWWIGWDRFHQIKLWHPGWGPDDFGWKLLYATDYLACCLIFAGPVTSISRYWHTRWFSLGYHGAHAGPELWGSVRSGPVARVLAPLFWIPTLAAIVWAIVYLIWRLFQ